MRGDLRFIALLPAIALLAAQPPVERQLIVASHAAEPAAAHVPFANALVVAPVTPRLAAIVTLDEVSPPLVAPTPTPRPQPKARISILVPRHLLLSRAEVVAVVEAAAAEFGQDAEAMLKVAHCESTFRLEAVGKAGEIGLFQFMPRTWERNGARLGYTMEDVWDPVAQSRVTAEMWSRGQAYQWSCWRRLRDAG